MWTPRQGGDVPEEIAELVEAYGGKSVPRGYRGVWDEKPGETVTEQVSLGCRVWVLGSRVEGLELRF